MEIIKNGTSFVQHIYNNAIVKAVKLGRQSDYASITINTMEYACSNCGGNTWIDANIKNPNTHDCSMCGDWFGPVSKEVRKETFIAKIISA